MRQAENLSFQVFLRLWVFSIDDRAYCLSKIGRDDSWRCLVATKPHLISRRSDGSEVEGVVALERHECEQHEEFEELCVFGGWHCKHVAHLSIGFGVVDGPVGMLSATIKAEEGLLVEQHRVTVTIERLLENLHDDQVLEDRLSGLIVYCAELELVVGHLVVLGLEGDAHLQQFTFYLLENLLNFEGHLSIVMVRKLLVFCSYSSEETSTGHSQVMTLEVSVLGHNEELLLESQCQEDVLVLDTKSSEHLRGCLLHDCFRFAVDGHVIEGLAVVRHQHRWDVHNFVFPADEDIIGPVPDVVGSGAVGSPQTTRREAASISLSLQQQFGGQVQSRLSDEPMIEDILEVDE